MLTKSDLLQIKEIVQGETSPIHEDLSVLKKNIKTLKKNLNKVQKTVDIIGVQFNRDDLKLQKRIKKIEEHVGFQPL